MADADFTLRLEIAPDRSPELATIGDLLVVWSQALRAAGSMVDPNTIPKVELVGVEPGSQRFRIVLRRLENFAETVRDGAADYPLVSKTAIALASLVAAGVVGALAQSAISPAPKLPPDQMKVFEEIRDQMREGSELHKDSQHFYGVLQNDPAILSVELLHTDEKPIYKVPRSEFAERSGLWGGHREDVYEPRQRFARWEVTLIRAAFVPEPRRWTFAKDGLEFGATMDDPRVLDAIKNRSLPIQIAEGVRLTVEMTYRETFDGRKWVADPASRRIKKVLKPKLPPPSVPLFPDPRAP